MRYMVCYITVTIFFIPICADSKFRLFPVFFISNHTPGNYRYITVTVAFHFSYFLLIDV